MPHSTKSPQQVVATQSSSSSSQDGTETSAPRTEPTTTADDRIRVKNRRKRYLDLSPEYFTSPELELADPLVYDRLVRRFQSAQEREAEGKARGHSGILEADLVRSEAKVEALKHPDPNSAVTYIRAPDGHILAVEHDEEAQDKEAAWERWVDLMTQRFLRGDDKDFDYGAVDGSDEYDDRDEEERRRLEEYIDDQTPEFLSTPSGETGIQDF